MQQQKLILVFLRLYCCSITVVPILPPLLSSSHPTPHSHCQSPEIQTVNIEKQWSTLSQNREDAETGSSQTENRRVDSKDGSGQKE